MTLCRLILPDWAKNKDLPRVIEGELTDEQIKEYNSNGYSIFFIPNGPSDYKSNTPVTGADITTFDWCFVDCDIKDGIYKDKDAFIEKVCRLDLPPTRIIDSGNGIHVYWKVSNLDAMGYLRFQRRLMRLLQTDEAVGKIFQLMRLPGTINTKYENAQVPCELIYEEDTQYTAEELDKLLPPISTADEQYCKHHYDKTYNIEDSVMSVSDVMPPKFGRLLRENSEANNLWAGSTDDRSMNDWRLAHLMFANGFTKDEAASVLVNSAKAMQRSPIHRINYAQNIIEKIWTFELSEDKETLDLSLSVKELLSRGEDTAKGSRFRCHPRIDSTYHGFRLGQVIGLVAGSGVGKTAFALNMFKWFIQCNPEYDHFFIPLEQPAKEIADRWQTMCAKEPELHSKVQIMSNYDEDNNYRHLSLHEIQEYIKKYTRISGRKVGCVVIDHIGVLKKKDKNGKTLELEEICHAMKSFAVETNTLLVMQSQTNREKAGIGDLELNKDAAYGTVFFESYVDYLITLWQPLKRCHSEEACPTVTAFKFCKIRHKKAKRDIIQEDVPYYFAFDSETESMKDMTGDQITSFTYFLTQATNKRKADRKTEILTYQSVPYKEGVNGTNSNRQSH
jgi:hypothetical protein